MMTHKIISFQENKSGTASSTQGFQPHSIERIISKKAQGIKLEKAVGYKVPKSHLVPKEHWDKRIDTEYFEWVETEVFTIGDLVTNGSPMVGKITRFDMLDGEIYVETTWSKVGMGLSDLLKLPQLPSAFHPGQLVKIERPGISVSKAYILNVHFHGSKLKISYDIETVTPPTQGIGMRFYNIDEPYLESYEKVNLEV